MSLVADGFASWRECRAEYDLVLYADYVRAEVSCNAALLNARGRARGIDPMSLFMGPWTRARAYASEELLEHWESHPRTCYADFERQWRASRDEAWQ